MWAPACSASPADGRGVGTGTPARQSHARRRWSRIDQCKRRPHTQGQAARRRRRPSQRGGGGSGGLPRTLPHLLSAAASLSPPPQPRPQAQAWSHMAPCVAHRVARGVTGRRAPAGHGTACGSRHLLLTRSAADRGGQCLPAPLPAAALSLHPLHRPPTKKGSHRLQRTEGARAFAFLTHGWLRGGGLQTHKKGGGAGLGTCL